MDEPADDGRGGTARSLDDLGRETEHVLRYRVEIERRLGASGVGSIAEALASFERLRRAVDVLSVAELGWTRERVAGLIARVEAYAAELATVRQLKRRIGG
jgi:hypothetical protein